MSKAVNTRVPDELADELAAVAEYDGVAVSDLVREALVNIVNSRRASPEFKARVLESAERTKKFLEELGENEAAKRFDVSR